MAPGEKGTSAGRQIQLKLDPDIAGELRNVFKNPATVAMLISSSGHALGYCVSPPAWQLISFLLQAFSSEDKDLLYKVLLGRDAGSSDGDDERGASIDEVFAKQEFAARFG